MRELNVGSLEFECAAAPSPQTLDDSRSANLSTENQNHAYLIFVCICITCVDWSSAALLSTLRRREVMDRCKWILAVWLLAANAVRGEEPARPLRVVLVHSVEAEGWLASLGRDVVRVESLVPNSSDANEWAAAEHQAHLFGEADAIVTCHRGEDILFQFWADRLRNQRPIEIVTLGSSPARNRWEHERNCLQKAHGLLLKLCPEAKATLDKRMQAELFRRHPAVVTREPVTN